MANKRISLFGYGKTTQALSDIMKNAIFYDDSCKEPYCDKGKYLIRSAKEFDPDFSDMEIPSPGIPPYNPLIKKAKHLISEYDYFSNLQNLQIWISGTNGKTTTTQMMQHLLKDKGSVCGGNIGTPLAKLDQKAPIWILETSSFTLHYTTKASPNVYVLLPLSPDHLSWHGNMQEYIQAKLKPLQSMRSIDKAIIPKAYAGVNTQAKIYPYEDEDDLAQIFGFQNDKIKFKGAFLLDALLAMAVDTLLFERKSYDVINSFTLEPHRQEEFFDKKERLWVNDTKATNLDATKAAVKRYEDKKIHLILGGDDKGVDLQELFEFLADKNIVIYTVGSNEQKLLSLAKAYHLNTYKTGTLKHAVQKIAENLQHKEVALLSPAAASFDQFTSYAQRGELFKKYVNDL